MAPSWVDSLEVAYHDPENLRACESKERDVALSRRHDGHTRLVHFSWHICDAAFDARRRRRKAGEAVSAVLDRDACEQHGLLWTSRRSVLTLTFRVSSELNH